MEVNDQMTEETADQLLSDIEQGPQDQAAQKEEPKTAVEEFDLKVGGKEIKATRDKLIKWAEMGYDAPNKIGELNKKLEGYTQKEGQFKEWEQKYGTVDQYVRQNPQWWDFVQQQWQQAQNQRQNDPTMSIIEKLQEKVNGLESVAQTAQQRWAQQQATQEDSAYMDELQTIQNNILKLIFQLLIRLASLWNIRFLNTPNKMGSKVSRPLSETSTTTNFLKSKKRRRRKSLSMTKRRKPNSEYWA